MTTTPLSTIELEAGFLRRDGNPVAADLIEALAAERDENKKAANAFKAIWEDAERERAELERLAGDMEKALRSPDGWCAADKGRACLLGPPAQGGMRMGRIDPIEHPHMARPDAAVAGMRVFILHPVKVTEKRSFWKRLTQWPRRKWSEDDFHFERHCALEDDETVLVDERRGSIYCSPEQYAALKSAATNNTGKET